MGLRVGIDLGTTYSSVSWFNENSNHIETVDLDCADGNRILRSVVYFPGDGKSPVVGEAAWNALRQYPDQVVVGVKRSMGLQDFKVGPIDGKKYSAPEVSAELLKAMVKDASNFLGETVTDAVITVPAHFQDPELAATKEAGELAGLNVLALLPEPHAAALAYSVEQAVNISDQYILVYDLGGGTFDVTLIHATSSDVEGMVDLDIRTICKAGNKKCGGLDWDAKLCELVAEKAMEEAGVDARENDILEANLMDRCEKGKRDLSRITPVHILADLGATQVEISQTEFEDVTGGLLLATEARLKQVLDEAVDEHGINRDSIQILLTGGSSKMPMVSEMIENVTGKPPMKYDNPDLLVSKGAAYWAHLIEGKTITQIVEDEDGQVEEQQVHVPVDNVTDVATYCVGIEVQRPDQNGDMKPYNRVLLPSGMAYGESIDKEFYKVEDGMEEIEICLTISDHETEDINECRILAAFTISGLPQAGKKDEPVRVRLGYDENGMICGEAEDINTGAKADIAVDREVIQNKHV